MIYALTDCLQKSKQYPETFFVPSIEEIKTLKINDYAQLFFSTANNNAVERMWVSITRINGEQFEGTLENDPALLHDLHYGMKVVFKAEHIAKILPR